MNPGVMKTKVVLKLAIVAFLISCLVTGCKKNTNHTDDRTHEIEAIGFFTENYPPFNYEEEVGIYGVSVDIFYGLLTKMNVNTNEISLTLTEWETAYQKTLHEANTMLFSMVRIPEREDLFKWVGPIAPQKDVIIAMKSQQIEIANAADLATHTIGVIAGYSNVAQLINLGVPPSMLIEVHSLKSLYEGLVSGMYDCIAYSEVGHNLVVASMGYDKEDFDIAFTMQVTQLYFAFNINTSDDLIVYFQSTLDNFKMDKTEDGSSVYEKILNKYHVIQHIEDNITEQMVIDLVNTTASHFENDAPGTIAKINSGQAPYIDPLNPSLYAFAYDTTATMRAHATNFLLVGVNFKGKTDAAGKAFRDEIIRGALAHGTGWEDYIYTKPDQSGLYYKTTYYKLCNASDGNQYVVCAGRYK
jgi:polar amino acid transport system substrate-binding protein